MSLWPKLTETSGRGVGLDAVRQLVAEQGGQVRAAIRDAGAGADDNLNIDSGQFVLLLIHGDQEEVIGAVKGGVETVERRVVEKFHIPGILRQVVVRD